MSYGTQDRLQKVDITPWREVLGREKPERRTADQRTQGPVNLRSLKHPIPDHQEAAVGEDVVFGAPQPSIW